MRLALAGSGSLVMNCQHDRGPRGLDFGEAAITDETPLGTSNTWTRPRGGGIGRLAIRVHFE
jgi:hypothetical protein